MSTEEIINSHEFDDLKKKVIEGVGKDAEVVTNDKGGKQSKTPMALHLVDPFFLKAWAQGQIEVLLNIEDNFGKPHGRDLVDEEECYTAVKFIADFMETGDYINLSHAMVRIENDNIKRLIRIAKVLQYGADRYEANNWRLIPQESHINHALIHILADIMGDTQDDHLDHALCRLMMAMSTEKSEGFDYNKYVSKVKLKLDTPPKISFDVDNSKPTCSYKIADICYQISTAERILNGLDKCFIRLCLSQYNGPKYEDEIRDPEIIEFLKNRYKEIIKYLKEELNKEIDNNL